jgi:chromate transporter
MSQLPALIGVFAYLSLLTMGGGMAAFPELKVLTVDVHRWLTLPQLIHLYSVGQMAPGPNMMMVASIGEWVAGVRGSVAVLLAFFLPTALLTFGVGRLWIRIETWPWRASIQLGLAPVSIGLILAGCLTIAKGAVTGWLAVVIMVAVFAVLLRIRINPALLVLGGALISLFAFSAR